MRLNPWALWFLVAGILAPYLYGLGWITYRRFKSSRPGPPDVLLPLGWRVWHWHRQKLYQFEWTGRRWRRTACPPILPADIPELTEEHQ